VGSGQAIVTVDPDGTSRLANLGGRAATVTTDEGRVRVPAGTGTVVRLGEAPSPPRPLPPAPVWLNDLAGRFVGLTGRGGTLRGSWEPVPEASRYRVEIAAQPDGSDVVAAVEVPGDESAFEIHHLPPGVYYASVATIDDALFEGTPSPLRAMQVLSARIIPPGGTEPVEEPYDPGDPSRPASTPRVLPGTWVVAPIGMRCGAGDETPREMITLREPGPTHVRCVDAANRELPSFDVLVLRVRVRIEDGARIARGEASEVRLRLDPPPPPGARFVADAEGARVSRPRVEPDGTVVLSVTPERGAPDPLPLVIGTLAADERIEIARTTLAVGDPAGVATAGAGDGADDGRTSGEPEPEPSPSALVLDAVPVGTAAPLRRAVPDGFVAWIAAGARPGLTEVPLVVGSRARVFDEPLWLGLAWGTVARRAPTSGVDRAAAASVVRGEIAFLGRRQGDLDVTLSLGSWARLASDSRLQLVPSLELDYRLDERITLRTRQSAVLGAYENARHAWGGAFGAELVLAPHFAAALELDVTANAGAASVVPSLSVAARVASLELVVGALYADGPVFTAALRGVFTR